MQYAHGSGKEGSKLSSGSRSPEGGRDTRAVTPSSVTEKAALKASNAGEGTWGGLRGHGHRHKPEMYKKEHNKILNSREDCPDQQTPFLGSPAWGLSSEAPQGSAAQLLAPLGHPWCPSVASDPEGSPQMSLLQPQVLSKPAIELPAWASSSRSSLGKQRPAGNSGRRVGGVHRWWGGGFPRCEVPSYPCSHSAPEPLSHHGPAFASCGQTASW